MEWPLGPEIRLSQPIEKLCHRLKPIRGLWAFLTRA